MGRKRARYFCLVISCFLGQHSGYASDFKSEEISVMTWNVLGEHSSVFKKHFPAQTRSETWFKERLLAIFEEIAKIRADVICLQEVSPDLYGNFCRSNLPYRYLYHPVNRSGVLLGYHKDIFSESRSVSLKLDGASSGKVICALLQHKKSAMGCVVSCVHISRAIQRFTRSWDNGRSVMIDHEEQGRRQMTSVLESIAQIDQGNEYPVIIAGDFNTEDAEMQRHAFDLKISLFKHRQVTFTTPRNSFYSIDHVLHRGAMKLVEEKSYVGDTRRLVETCCRSRARLTDAGEYFRTSWSDHMPVVATFAMLRASIGKGGVNSCGGSLVDGHYMDALRLQKVRDDKVLSDAELPGKRGNELLSTQEALASTRSILADASKRKRLMHHERLRLMVKESQR